MWSIALYRVSNSDQSGRQVRHLSHAGGRLLQRVAVEAVMHEHGHEVAVLRVHDVAPQLPRPHLHSPTPTAAYHRNDLHFSGQLASAGAFCAERLQTSMPQQLSAAA